MKKKILFGIAALMIAAAATFHVQNVAFGEKESYASLESIGVMAEAWGENGGGPSVKCYGRHDGWCTGGYRLCGATTNSPCGHWVNGAKPDTYTQSSCML